MPSGKLHAVGDIVTLNVVAHLPPDLPARLRRMADDVEAGLVTAMVVAYVYEGRYEFLWPSSRADSVLLTALAHASALERMRP